MAEIIKRNSKYQKKKSYKRSILISGTNSVGQPYELLFLPDQISQFEKELNHLLCNTEALFASSLTF